MDGEVARDGCRDVEREAEREPGCDLVGVVGGWYSGVLLYRGVFGFFGFRSPCE